MRVTTHKMQLQANLFFFLTIMTCAGISFQINYLYYFFFIILIVIEECSSVVVKTLCYKPEGRGFDTR
jgi:hypothetical protein